MAAKPFFRMSLIALMTFQVLLAVAAEAPERQVAVQTAKTADGNKPDAVKIETGLPVSYEGQRMNPGRETTKQMETLLRKQYVDWVLSWNLPQGGRPVREAVPQIRLPKLKFNLQRCSEANGRFRHPKPKELNRVSFIQVDNQCAETKVSQALAPIDGSGTEDKAAPAGSAPK